MRLWFLCRKTWASREEAEDSWHTAARRSSSEGLCIMDIPVLRIFEASQSAIQRLSWQWQSTSRHGLKACCWAGCAAQEKSVQGISKALSLLH